MGKYKLTTPQDAKALATFVAKVADEKLAANIIVMDMTHIEAAPSDYFVICSCDSTPQLQAVSDFILRQIRSAKVDKPRTEGERGGEWILLDFFDVVVHVMLPQVRSFYKIEKLWVDAIFYKFNPETLKLNKATQAEVIDLISEK